MPRDNNRSRNNRSGDWGVMEMARDRPIAAAAAAAGAAAAGLFLWSRRNQISHQLSSLSDQISEWTENMRSDDTGGLTTSSQRSTGARSRTPNRGMSETGGGNASLGRATGGAGNLGSPSGRGRAKDQPTM